MNYLLTVVIPTHNRTEYLIPTVSAIYNHIENVQIVVTDSSDNECVSELMPNYIKNSSRYVYRKTPRNFNFVENFESGLDFVTGEYVTYIGDDDFIHPEILNLLRWCKDKKIDAITSTLPAIYYWPDFYHRRHKSNFSGVLTSKEFTGNIENVDAKRALDSALANLGSGVQNMPRIYAGVVSMNIVRQARKEYDRVFGGVSPDIYSSAIISQIATKCISVDYPFVIPGSSGNSGSGESARGSHIGPLRGSSYMARFKELKWNNLVPEFYSIQTVWAFSILSAMHKMSLLEKKIGYERLYIKCFFCHPAYYRYTFDALKCYSVKKNILKIVYNLLENVVLELLWVVERSFLYFQWKVSKGKAGRYVRSSLTNSERALPASIDLFKSVGIKYY